MNGSTRRDFLVSVAALAAGCSPRAKETLPWCPPATRSGLSEAVSYLEGRQSPDGAWRSDVYGTFKDGTALTPLVVHALQPDAERHGFLAAPLVLAAVQALDDPLQVHLVGPAGDPGLRALWRTAWRRYAPSRVTEILDPALDGARLSRLGYPADGPPRAYVCVGDRCLEPVSDPGLLADRLAEAAAGRSGP